MSYFCSKVERSRRGFAWDTPLPSVFSLSSSTSLLIFHPSNKSVITSPRDLEWLSTITWFVFDLSDFFLLEIPLRISDPDLFVCVCMWLCSVLVSVYAISLQSISNHFIFRFYEVLQSLALTRFSYNVTIYLNTDLNYLNIFCAGNITINSLA